MFRTGRNFCFRARNKRRVSIRTHPHTPSLDIWEDNTVSRVWPISANDSGAIRKTAQKIQASGGGLPVNTPVWPVA